MMDANTFAAMAETGAKVLRHNPNLPLAYLDIGPKMVGQVGQRRDVVAFQCYDDKNTLRAMALWALEFGSPLRVIAKSTFVEISTEAVVDGHTVVVWDHVPPAELERLLSLLRLTSVESLSSLEPDTLLAVDEPSEVAS